MLIKLIPWSLDNKQALIKMCNKIDRSFLADRMPDPYTEEAADWWLNMVEENEGRCGVFRKIIVDGRLAGAVSVEQKTDVYRRDAEIGYYLLPEYNSKGIMTKAVSQMCVIAFGELDLIRITGLVYESNIASRKVLEKNGFVLEGVMNKAVTKGEKIHNLCIYGRLK